MAEDFRLILGDCRSVAPDLIGEAHLVLADPPYAATSLLWDREVAGWHGVAASYVREEGSLWLFGNLKSIVRDWGPLDAAGMRYAQDIVWEKHNGSSFHADRFRRVHEHVAHFYRKDTPWRRVWRDVLTTPDATARTVRRKRRPPHMGNIGRSTYASQDGGPRLMRSVLQVRSCHGRAIHPTEKPTGVLETIIRHSCPEGGLVVDMFAGSASAAEACMNLKRRYVGFEVDATIRDRALARMLSCLVRRRYG